MCRALGRAFSGAVGIPHELLRACGERRHHGGSSGGLRGERRASGLRSRRGRARRRTRRPLGLRARGRGHAAGLLRGIFARARPGAAQRSFAPAQPLGHPRKRGAALRHLLLPGAPAQGAARRRPHERGCGGGLDRPGRGAHAFRCRAAQARAPDYLQSHLHRGSDLGGRGVEHSLRRARAAASGGAGVRRGGARLRGERDMSARFTPPDNEAMVGPFAQCVRHPNATPLTYHGTNSWILAAPNDGACVVVDPGPDDAACIGRIAEACARRGLTVAAVAVTHDHFDHAECAEEAGRVFGAPVLGVASGTLGPGPLELPGVSLAIEVVPLPGHSSDSVGFLVEEGALVVTGDVVFAQSPTMVCWPDGRMGDYLASLDVLGRLVAERGVERLLTGHGPVIENPSERIEQARRHRLQRLQQVVSAVRSGIPADAEALVEAVYNDVRPELHDGAVRSVNAQLRYAFDEGILQENR
ncbi:hypothetical protein C1850_07850 [Adlercreutzia equolifaciens subsp. celatus]|uniref:Metallo-beta-lactamase domain-containing protein n=3 Tax=Eggerthellaceae TaxID=1643826 RepID=A0A369NZS3_9ACTN|nr:hypothetical protein C1850_07850 [Adlercreutzia equolifaciens subsp. celatus]